MSQSKKRKARSQAPVALVYFATMLTFLVIIGMAVLMLFKKYDFLGGSSDDSQQLTGYTSADGVTTLYAHVNTKGILCDAMLVRFSPAGSQVILVPLSPYIHNEKTGATLRDVQTAGGIEATKKAVEEIFEVRVDKYVALTNTAVNEVCDLLGGYTYTPIEDLYYLSEENDENDISIKKGTTITLTGQQIRLIMSYPVFSEGKMGNVKFMAAAFESMLSTAFELTDLTKNNLDTLYRLSVADAVTDLTEKDYQAQRKIIEDMLDRGTLTAVSLIPTGNWDGEQTAFTVSQSFKEEIADSFSR